MDFNQQDFSNYFSRNPGSNPFRPHPEPAPENGGTQNFNYGSSFHIHLSQPGEYNLDFPSLQGDKPSNFHHQFSSSQHEANMDEDLISSSQPRPKPNSRPRGTSARLIRQSEFALVEPIIENSTCEYRGSAFAPLNLRYLNNSRPGNQTYNGQSHHYHLNSNSLEGQRSGQVGHSFSRESMSSDCSTLSSFSNLSTISSSQSNSESPTPYSHSQSQGRRYSSRRNKPRGSVKQGLRCTKKSTKKIPTAPFGNRNHPSGSLQPMMFSQNNQPPGVDSSFGGTEHACEADFDTCDHSFPYTAPNYNYNI